MSDSKRRRLLVLFAVLVIAVSVRVLTLQFMRAHLNDASWFQFGSYAIFDQQARDIIEGQQHLFVIDDPSRTDLVQYPPAYPATVALIYKLTGNHSAYSVQIVQWFADLLLSFIVIIGIAVTAFDWRVGVATSFSTGAVSFVCNVFGLPFGRRANDLACSGWKLVVVDCGKTQQRLVCT
jgi:hypothetical protein